MDDSFVTQFVGSLLTVLVAGFVAGAVCKRLGISMLVGYLVVGGVIGEGGFGLVTQESHELEYLAKAGALLLLFSVGIEFSFDELKRMLRHFLVGGSAQMLLVTLPLMGLYLLYGMSWRPALLAAAACALSSTILVFKALAEWGHSSTPHGRRAISILLFQDVALVPLMLLIPLLTGGGAVPTIATYSWLLVKSLLFLVAVILFRMATSRWMVTLLSQFRSVELVILFTLVVLTGACWGSAVIGLPPAIGALAAGLILSGNRLSTQIDTIILPYRESFAAIFFVTLGTLLQPALLLQEPVLLIVGIIVILALKTIAAALALRLIGLRWKASFGMGVGLAQLGEFSFLIVATAVQEGVIAPANYHRLLFIALGTLIVTPHLMTLGLRWADLTLTNPQDDGDSTLAGPKVSIQQALVIGIGPIGRQIASRMETFGIDVCLIDYSPINLHPFAQQGFQTVAGDARDPDVLHRANARHCRLAVVCVPADDIAALVVKALRELGPEMAILVRCRFLGNVSEIKKAGANNIICEEREASTALLYQCDHYFRTTT
ncbi:MAG: cation:proton antiporter [Planctomycetaceae bacterium]